MMNVNFILACDQIIADVNGKISLIGIFSEIFTQSVPANHPLFSVVTMSEGVVGMHTQKIEIVNLNNDKVIASTEQPFEIKKGGVNYFAATFTNIIFPEIAIYWIKVTIDGQVCSDKKLNRITLKQIEHAR